MKKFHKVMWIVAGISWLTLIIIILYSSGFNLVEWMMKLGKGYYDAFGDIGVIWGIFLISMISNFVVVLPIPYAFVLIALIMSVPTNPFLLGFSAGLGAGIGKMISWFIGRGTGEALKATKYREKIMKLKEMIQREKWIGFSLVFLIACTPLPDDAVFIALGIAQFPVLLTLIASISGKLVLTMSTALVVWLIKGGAAGEFLLGIYGVKVVNGEIINTENPIVSAISLVITILIAIALLKIDWEKFFERKILKK